MRRRTKRKDGRGDKDKEDDRGQGMMDRPEAREEAGLMAKKAQGTPAGHCQSYKGPRTVLQFDLQPPAISQGLVQSFLISF